MAPLLEVSDLRIHFQTDDGLVKSVDGVSFVLERGRTLGIVGESGSGKSVTSMGIMGLHQGTKAKITGYIRLDGEDLVNATPGRVRELRGSKMAMIFQDPLSSLHPYYKVGDQIIEAYRVHNKVSKKAARQHAIDLLGRVGIPTPETRVDDYPHHFSGGMRQRVMIAMAVSCNPDVLIADEPTTALDVTSQAQIVDLLKELQHRHGTAVILVTHDLGLVAQIAERVLVMYAGRLVETAGVDDLFAHPHMPYTWALLQSMPSRAPRGADLITIPGQPPNLLHLPPGCSFSPRCPFAGDACSAAVPTLAERSPGHSAACVLEPAELSKRQHDLEAEVSPMP